jgi:hypothetical protein
MNADQLVITRLPRGYQPLSREDAQGHLLALDLIRFDDLLARFIRDAEKVSG